jgi:ABC-type transport system involved in multi-copper enzyme maturation permease subunit
VRALTITAKDTKRLLKSPKFYFSLFLTSMAIVGLKVLSSVPFLPLPPMFLARFIFTLSLPCLGLAILSSNSDIMSSEYSEGTILVLYSQPVSNASIILGKFFAMLLSSLIFTGFDTLLIKFLHPYIWETTEFVSETQILTCYFFAALLFQLPIIGLTLLFSSLFKRSATITIVVILIYETLAVLYASQLIWSVPQHVPGIAGLSILIQIFILLLGSILGYDIVRITPALSINEPEVIKYLPINVNSQRLLYFLISPNPEIALPEALISLLSIIMITVLSILLSFLVIKRKRSEYRE